MTKKNEPKYYIAGNRRIGYKCGIDGKIKSAAPGDVLVPQKADIPAWLDSGAIIDPELHTGEEATLTPEAAAELARTKGILAELKSQKEIIENNLETLNGEHSKVRTEVDRKKQELDELTQKTTTEKDAAAEVAKNAKQLRDQAKIDEEEAKKLRKKTEDDDLAAEETAKKRRKKAQDDLDAAEELEKKTKALQEKTPEKAGGGSDGGGAGAGAGAGSGGGSQRLS